MRLPATPTAMPPTHEQQGDRRRAARTRRGRAARTRRGRARASRSAAQSSAAATSPPSPPWIIPSATNGPLHVGLRGAHEPHDVELVLARVDGQADDVRDREDAGEDEDPAQEGADAAHEAHRRWRAARSRAGRTGSPARPGRAVEGAARAAAPPPATGGRRAGSPRARRGTGSRRGRRAASSGRGTAARKRASASLAAHELERVDRRVARAAGSRGSPARGPRSRPRGRRSPGPSRVQRAHHLARGCSPRSGRRPSTKRLTAIVPTETALTRRLRQRLVERLLEEVRRARAAAAIGAGDYNPPP